MGEGGDYQVTEKQESAKPTFPMLEKPHNIKYYTFVLVKQEILKIHVFIRFRWYSSPTLNVPVNKLWISWYYRNNKMLEWVR